MTDYNYIIINITGECNSTCDLCIYGYLMHILVTYQQTIRWSVAVLITL